MKNYLLTLLTLFIPVFAVLGQVTCSDIEPSLYVSGLTGVQTSQGEEIISENGGHIEIQFNNSIAPHAFMTYMDNVMYDYPYVSSSDNQNRIRFDISIDDPSDPINNPTESYPWLQLNGYQLLNNNIGAYTEGTDLNSSVHNIDYSTYEFNIGENNSIEPRYIRIILKVCGNQVINRTYYQPGMIKYLDAGTISYPQEYAGSVVGYPEITGTPATGGTCSNNYLYRWEKKTLNSAWTAIPDAVSMSYTPTDLTDDTEFRRKVICDGVEMYAPSRVLIKYCPGVLSSGEISCNNTSIQYNESPGIIEGISPASGWECDGSYSYEWHKCEGEDSENWVRIPRAVDESYEVPNLVITTKFKRRATLPWYGMLKEAFTDEIVITVKKTNAVKTENYIISYAPQVGRESLIEVFSEEIYKLNSSIQYFDGLGRPKQSIAISNSPNKKDIVQPIVYDDFGRESKKYLPYVATTGANGTYRDGAKDSVMNYYAMGLQNADHALTGSPFSQTVFENSPLNRMIAQGAPGETWQPTFDSSGKPTFKGHTIKMDYQTNTSNNVRLFDVVNGQLDGSTYYAEGELYKTISKDENWTDTDPDVFSPEELLHSTEEFKDKLGQVVLKRSYVDTSKVEGVQHIASVETYYVYDDFGLLRYVLPPEAVKQMFNGQAPISDYKVIGDDSILETAEENVTSYLLSQGASLTLKPGFSFTASSGKTLSIAAGNVTADLVYAYNYDSRKRMIEKKIPGAHAVYMVYDERDRLVATQDAEMRAKNQWLFTKYDGFNRPVATGIYNRDITRVLLQDEVNDYAGTMFESRGSVRHGYNNVSWPQVPAVNDYLSVTYYDDYSFPGKKGFETAHNVSDETTFFTSVKGLVTGTLTQVLDDDAFTDSTQWTRSTNYYDDKYRVFQTIADLYPANSSNKIVVSSNYDFVGKIENTKQVQSFQGTTKTIEERYEYDHAGRLLETWHNIDQAGEVLLAKNEYNDLGELTKKYVGGSTDANCAQATDYAYNIRGWLTQLNDPNVTTDAKRKFGMHLHYNDTISGLTNTAQFNGNISAIEWCTPSNSSIGSPNGKQAYGFKYDALNRVTAADYGEGSSFATNPNAFNVSGLQYDLNGNIMHLNREKAIKTSSAAFTPRQIDNLSYAYAGNQLLSVNDAANATYKDMDNVLAKDYGFKDGASSAVEYLYDTNGNMKRDDNKGLANVDYNYLNLPQKLTSTDNKIIEYIYDANGQKLAKTADGETTYYAGNMVYKESSLQYILHAEGKYEITENDAQYQFDIKDHLGNVRLVVNKYSTELQQSAYYPFGMAFQKGGNADNKYLYNGKELQNDDLGGVSLDWYDYGKRFYDASLARWHVADPRAEKYYSHSPYNYCINNPLTYVDPEGDTIRIAAGQSEEFINQLNADLNALRNNDAFAGMMEFLDGNEKDIIIGEGSSVVGDIFNAISEGSGDEYHAKTSEAKDMGVQGVSVTISQVEGVEIDGVKTQTTEVTVHELTHAFDMLNGNYQKDIKDSKKVEQNQWNPLDTSREDYVRDKMESRAMKNANKLRTQKGKKIRTRYKGKKLL